MVTAHGEEMSRKFMSNPCLQTVINADSGRRMHMAYSWKLCLGEGWPTEWDPEQRMGAVMHAEPMNGQFTAKKILKVAF